MKKKTAVTKSKTQSANKLMQKEKIFEWSLGSNLAEVLLAKSFPLDCKNSGIFFLEESISGYRDFPNNSNGNFRGMFCINTKMPSRALWNPREGN